MFREMARLVTTPKEESNPDPERQPLVGRRPRRSAAEPQRRSRPPPPAASAAPARATDSIAFAIPVGGQHDARHEQEVRVDERAEHAVRHELDGSGCRVWSRGAPRCGRARNATSGPSPPHRLNIVCHCTHDGRPAPTWPRIQPMWPRIHSVMPTRNASQKSRCSAEPLPAAAEDDDAGRYGEQEQARVAVDGLRRADSRQSIQPSRA